MPDSTKNTTKKNDNRKLTSRLRTEANGDEYILLLEKEGYIPTGYSRKQWSEQTVTISLDELRALAKKYLGTDK